MTSPLARLGWDDAWASALAHVPADSDLAGPDAALVGADLHDVAVGRVSRADRDHLDVVVAVGDGLTVRDAVPSTALRRSWRSDPSLTAVTGDWVLLDARADHLVVERVLPRRSAVVRAQVDRSSHGQVLAANADVVAVVEGMAPDPDAGRIERLLALAWASGADPLVVLTKADLVPEPDRVTADVAALAPGVAVLATSATTGTGLEHLRERLAGGATVALLGASGVGKSTLLNALVGEATMRTNALRADGKGRHTTVTRELHLAPDGGAVLDTPGLRTVGLAGTQAAQEVFTEVAELAEQCRFADCAHVTEPGCAVLAALEDGRLTARRLESYRTLLREERHHAARTDARLRAEMTQVWKARTREYRRRPHKKT